MATHIIFGELDIAPLLKAQKMFIEGLDQAKTPLEKTGVMQRFELCYELVWKTELAEDIFAWLPDFGRHLNAFISTIEQLA